MNETALQYEIRDVPDTEGGLRLGLFVEGKRIATASASLDVLDAMSYQLGFTRDAVADDLRTSLLDLLKNQLEKVTVTKPQEVPQRPLRFQSMYTYRDFDNLYAGLVWYDVQTSETGPEGVPAIARNKLRQEVHRLLTGDGSRAREIVDLSR